MVYMYDPCAPCCKDIEIVRFYIHGGEPYNLDGYPTKVEKKVYGIFDEKEYVTETRNGTHQSAAIYLHGPDGLDEVLRFDAGHHDLYTVGCAVTSDKEFVIALSDETTLTPGNGKIIKFDRNLETIWEITAGSNIEDMKILPDDSVVVTGQNFVGCYDKDGSQVWTYTQIGSLFDAFAYKRRLTYYHPLQALYVNNVSNHFSAYNPSVIKFDLDGNKIWEQDFSYTRFGVTNYYWNHEGDEQIVSTHIANGIIDYDESGGSLTGTTLNTLWHHSGEAITVLGLRESDGAVIREYDATDDDLELYPFGSATPTNMTYDTNRKLTSGETFPHSLYASGSIGSGTPIYRLQPPSSGAVEGYNRDDRRLMGSSLPWSYAIFDLDYFGTPGGTVLYWSGVNDNFPFDPGPVKDYTDRILLSGQAGFPIVVPYWIHYDGTEDSGGLHGRGLYGWPIYCIFARDFEIDQTAGTS